MKFTCGRIRILAVKETKRLFFSQWLLILIIVLAAFFRLYKIFDTPPSLNWDEVSHGYNAFSILKTQKDEWGVRFPLIFRAYGDYKLPLYIYLTVFSEMVFGLNTFSVRFVSILSGIGLVLVAYFISLRVFKEKNISLLSAFLVTLSPWSLFLSRVAVEANLGAFLFSLGMYFAIIWLESFRIKDLSLTLLFWGFSLYSYNSARILVPVFVAIILVDLIRRKRFRQLALTLIILLIFSLSLAKQFVDKTGRARFNLVSLIDQGAVIRIGETREKSPLPAVLTRIVYNKPTFFIAYALKNYVSNLSPKYLFFQGGSHYQFSQTDHELLYLVSAPFLLLGLIRVLFKGNRQEKIIVFWFFVSFLPSAITKDAPHVLRSILVLPSPMILSSLGLRVVLSEIEGKFFFRGKLLIAILVFGVLISFYKWWSDYQNIYQKDFSWAWQYGYKEVVSFVKESYVRYDQIFFTKRYGEPHEFIAFFWPWDPASYLKQKKWDYHANWYWVNSLDKFVFINDWEVKENAKCLPAGKAGQKSPQEFLQNSAGQANAKCLLITSPGNYPEGWTKIKEVYFLDGKTAFEILEKEI